MTSLSAKPSPPNPFRVALFLLGLAIAPVLFTAWIGAPIPRDWPTVDQVETLLRGLTVQHLHATLRIVVWAAWLAVLVGSVWEVVSYLAHRNRPASPARKPWFLRLTGALTLGTTATTALTATTTATAQAEATDTDQEPAALTKAPTTAGLDSSSVGSAPVTDPTVRQDSSTETVQIGDTLWDISKEELGAGEKWVTIYQHNKNKPQSDGGALTDPGLIQPGWKLTIPDTTGNDTTAPNNDKPETENPPAHEGPPRHGNAPPQLNEAPAESQDEGTTDSTGRDATDAGMWWAGGFVSIAAVTGLIFYVRKARHRVREYEQRTGRTGPRIRLQPPLDDLEQLVDTDNAPEPDGLLGTGDDGDLVSLMDVAAGGLGLLGPGADAVARAAITAALVTADQGAAANGCDVVTSKATLAELLDDAPLPTGIHRLWTYPDSNSALRALSRELINRTREPGSDTPLLAIMEDDVDRTVLDSLLAQGKDVGISALILGDWPHKTVTIAEDGSADPESATRFFTLTADAFDAALAALDDIAETTEEPITPPTGVADANASDVTFAQPGLEERSPAPDPEVPDPYLPKEKEEGGSSQIAEPDLVDAAATSTSVRLHLFGNFGVTVDGKPATIRRTKSRELLAYLALHPDGATRGELLEAIVPDTAVTKARCHFDTVVTYARKDLRSATKQPSTEMFILHNQGRYRLDERWFTSDIAEFEQHISAAAAIIDQTVADEHLTAALDLYAGEVAADIDSDATWPYAIRAHYAHEAHAACLTLAEHAATIANTDAAIQLLERAISIDRYAESAYQQLIHLHREHGDDEAAAKVAARLKSALATIGAKPSSET